MNAINRVLITGAGGFLGHAILRELMPLLESRDDTLTDIHLLDLDGDRLPKAVGLKHFVGSVTDAGLLARATHNVDVVMHCASVIDWGRVPRQKMFDVNVTGTELLLDACRSAGIRNIIYTSSMDVVCGMNALYDVDETKPYPLEYANYYAETKAMAERMILRFNGTVRNARSDDNPQNRLTTRTCAIRPCGMYGEEDPYHVAGTLDVLREGKLSARPGDGSAKFEHVYVGNVAQAHVLAMRRLNMRDPNVCGRAFFITDDSPAVNFLDFMEPIVEALGYELPPKNRTVPYQVMMAVGAFYEFRAWASKPFGGSEPPVLTRSSVRFVCKTHTFDGSRARQCLDYTPKYSYEEALARTIEWWKQHEAARAREATAEA